MRRIGLLVGLVVVFFASGTSAAGLTATPTSTPPQVCTPLPEPLHFTLTVDPPQPQVGDTVRVTVTATEASGLLFGHALVGLHGAALLFGQDPPSVRYDGLGGHTTIFTLEAQLGGTGQLTAVVDYETECACPPVCYYRRTVESAPFPVMVLGPTATPTPECPLPSCGADEVVDCPDACPGGCGAICATRTPTPCPTPPCGSEEVLVCPGSCPGSCGAFCATRTQTPIPVASPPPCAGDCDGDGAVVVAELVMMVAIALERIALPACPAGDAGNDGRVEVADLVTAVGHALHGCSAGAPTQIPIQEQ